MIPDLLMALPVGRGHRLRCPLWYAGYLQARVWDGLGKLLPRSVIVYTMIRDDREARASHDPSNWPVVHTRLLKEFATD
jgi:hypothetical protein